MGKCASGAVPGTSLAQPYGRLSLTSLALGGVAMIRVARFAPSCLLVLALPLVGCGGVGNSIPGTSTSSSSSTGSRSGDTSTTSRFDAGASTSTVGPSAGNAGTSQSGRLAQSCSDCRSTELCVAAVFHGDLCMGVGSSSGSSSGSTSVDAGSPDGDAPGGCPGGYSYDPAANCCEVDPITSYQCWPMPPSCSAGVDCDCASSVVLSACPVTPGQHAPCSVADGVLTCEWFIF